MYALLRPLLFRLDPERAHTLTLHALRFTGQFAPLRFLVAKYFEAPPKPVTAFGLTFRNPVGLAAGYDKDGLGARGLATLGFSHLELGTVTPRPQPGNPKPRVFRLPEDRAVINRMGFPGLGADFLQKQLSVSRPLSSVSRPLFPVSRPLSSVLLGINLGKNKDTPNEDAARDYLTLYDQFAPLADYLAINVSSPKTVGLRRLQARDALEGLLGQLAEKRVRKLAGERVSESTLQQPTQPNNKQTEHSAPPILVKLAPDLTDDELDDALAAITRTGMDGVIATNTTLRRENLRSPRAGETGGLSGAPLTALSTDIIRKIHTRTEGRLPIIGAGGIISPDDAKAKLDAGAVLVQVYTGLIYAGPGLVKAIVKSL
ncbi:MAG: quinone-dependent dihydroorotate dehydrogenase [Anaerolineales bacterium]|nr:quinone-dependent dihydroorotate dehydrogenase [Anaerolineales bacterium]